MKISQCARIGTLGRSYCAFLANLFVPVVRCTLPIANDILFAAAQLIPIVILISARRVIGWRRFVTVVAGVWLLIPAAPFGLGTAACIALNAQKGADDPLFERLHAESNGSATVAVYREYSDPFAGSTSGIQVRQECPIFPGIILVRSMVRDSPAYNGTVTLQAESAVIRIETDDERLPLARPRILRLRRFCWGPER